MGVSGSINNEIRATDIEGLIKGLMKNLASLAPHPDRPEHSGPLFISGTSEFTPPAEYEGMMGTIMMESVLGSSFAQAASDIAESVSTTLQDRSTTAVSVKLGQRNVVAPRFNRSVIRDQMMEAYMEDLRARLRLEGTIAYYQRTLYTLRKNALRWSLSYAA